MQLVRALGMNREHSLSQGSFHGGFSTRLPKSDIVGFPAMMRREECSVLRQYVLLLEIFIEKGH